MLFDPLIDNSLSTQILRNDGENKHVAQITKRQAVEETDDEDAASTLHNIALQGTIQM